MAQAATPHRLFFALTPDERTRAAIASLQSRLPAREGRRVPAERLHATLLFMGNQSGDDLARLCELAAGLDFAPCSLTLDRCGHFPRAGVVWLGADQDPPELAAFQRRLSEAVTSLGIAFDQKPWRLHVTLYRKLRKRPERIEFEPVLWELKDFCLMESVHNKFGLQYHCRGRWPA